MFVVVSFGYLQPRFDYFNVAPRRLTPLLRLLLKGVKDINHPGKANRVNGSISIAILIIDNFQNAAAGSSTAICLLTARHSAVPRQHHTAC